MSRCIRRLVAVLGMATLGVIGSPSGSAAFTSEVPVLVSRADEIHATAGWNRIRTVEYLGFTRKDPRTGTTNAFLRSRRSDGSFTIVRLNRSGDGDVGGFFFGPRVFYAQAPLEGDWNLRVFNIATDTRTVPRGVNTAKNEYFPTRSNGRLLFNRDDGDEGVATRIVLHDLRKTRDAETLLARTTSPDAFAYAGQVSGNWAVWTKCNPVCDVYKRDVDARLTTKMPKPVSDPVLDQYDASVTSDGTVYLFRSGAEPCASTVEMVRYGVADPEEGTVIAQLQPSSFTTLAYARSNRDGSVDVFFSRGNCTTFKSDIYKVNDPGGP